MKKAVIVLSALIIMLSGCSVTTSKTKTMPNDADTKFYCNQFFSYDNGTIGIPSPYVTSELTNTEAIPLTSSSYYSSYFNDSIVSMGLHKLKIDDYVAVESEEKIVSYKFFNENEIYYLTETAKLYRYSMDDKTNEQVLTLENSNQHFYVKDSYVYLEHLNDENTASVIEKYEFNSSKPLETFTLEFGEDITKKLEVIDLDIADYNVFEVNGFVFYDFYFTNYQYDNVYRYDTKTNKADFVGRFEQPSFCHNSTDICFAVENVGNPENHEYESSGIWKMNPSTLETEIITANYYNNTFLCTDNYLYILDDDIIQRPLN